jgi:hypothetical protein
MVIATENARTVPCLYLWEVARCVKELRFQAVTTYSLSDLKGRHRYNQNIF